MCKWQCPVTEECIRFVLGDGRVCMCVSYMCLAIDFEAKFEGRV